MKRRRGYKTLEAVQTLKGWMWKNRMRQADFVRELEMRGILITQAYLHQMFTGIRPPGPKFKEIFKEITGITLVDGLVEEKEQR